MSIVAVHGPNTMGGTGAGGGGTGPTITTLGGSVTADMSNGLRFTLTGIGDRQTYAWTFNDGTAAVNSKTGTVTFTTPGAKVITETVSGTGTTPTGGPFVYNVTADASPTEQRIENEAGVVTRDTLNGLLFTLAGKGDRAAADYDWKFGGTPADILNTKSTTVTFPTAGPKTITLTIGSSGGTTPTPSPPDYTFSVTATAGAMPRSMPGGGGNGEPPPAITEEVPITEPYDPGAHTVAEVESYADAHPDEVEEIYEAEVAGKNRTTLVTYLEALIPFDPGDYTVQEVVDYADENPDQLDDIIAAEQAGKNRTTLLTQLEALRE